MKETAYLPERTMHHVLALVEASIRLKGRIDLVSIFKTYIACEAMKALPVKASSAWTWNNMNAACVQFQTMYSVEIRSLFGANNCVIEEITTENVNRCVEEYV